MARYEILAALEQPDGDGRKNPGDKVSTSELKKWGQNDDDIKALVKAKALKEVD